MPGKRSLRIRAFAKINLTLRILGVRDDGYHELRTTFQSIALHDTLTFTAASGAFRLECDDPACPADRTNLVWQAAESMWQAAARGGAPRDVVVHLAKRIPMQAGLGGGSSDAAATLRALAALWRVKMPGEQMRTIASRLGADVPFFLDGGTALGVERGDVLFQLPDLATMWAAVVVPRFGIGTAEAYGWWDEDRERLRPRERARAIVNRRGRAAGLVTRLPPSDLRNDLERPVAARRPEIAHLLNALRRHGASYAAMSGSGSAVFGLFASRAAAASAARALAGRTCRTIVTRTLNRSRHAQRSWT